MGTDASRDRYQGLGIPDPRLDDPDSAIYTADTTVGQAGPEPGVPVPQQADTALVVTSGGVMAASDAFDVRCIRGGLTGPGQGGFAWRNRGATDWYGWDHSGLLTHHEPIRWGTAIGDDHEEVDVAFSADGTLVAVASVQIIGGFTLRAYTKARGATSWTTNTIDGDVANPLTVRPRAAVVRMPDQSLQVWYWVESSTNRAQVRVARSTDDGATWTTTATECLDTPVDTSGTPGAGAAGYVLDRIRVASTGGQTLLLAHLVANNTTPTYRSVYLQAAGAGNGEALQVVEYSAQTLFWGLVDIETVGDDFYVGRMPASVDQDVKVYRLSSAFLPLSLSSSVGLVDLAGYNLGVYDGTGKYATGGHLELFADDAGALYVVAQIDNAAQPYSATIISRSFDLGATWSPLGSYPAALSGTIDFSVAVALRDTATRLARIGCVYADGRVFMAYTHESSATTTDSSLGAIYLGGYSTVTIPGLDLFADDSRRVSWFQAGIPLDLPGAVGWTTSTSGGGTETINTSTPRLDLTTSGALDDQFYTLTTAPTGTVNEPLIARFGVAVITGAASTKEIWFGARLADGTNEYEVEVYLRTAGFIVQDVSGATQIASVALDMTTAREFLLSMDSGKVTIAYRTWDADASRDWTVAVDGGTVTNNTATPAANNRLQFGHENAATSGSNWYAYHFVSDAEAGLGFSAGYTNPSDLLPRYWAPPPFASVLPSGLTLQAQRGPGRTGDQWTVDPRYRYALASAWTQRTPNARRGWRSLNTTAQNIAVSLSTNGDPTALSDSILWTFIECNFAEFTLQGWDGSAYQTIASVDTTIEVGGWAIEGNTLTPNASAGSTTYVEANEFRGAVAIVGANRYRIVSHTAGVLGTDNTTRIARFYVTGLDSASSTTTTSGIIPRDFAVRFDLNGTSYRRFRLQIDSQATPEGYFEIGTLHIGRVEVFGTPPAWGWQTVARPNVDVQRAPDGTTRARNRGDLLRTYTVAWTDGVWEGQTPDGVGDPSYLTLNTNGSAEPIGLKHDTGMLVRGLLSEVDGARRPVVVLRTINRLTSPAVSEVYNRRDQFMLARLDGDVTVENIRGTEFQNELVRIAQLVADEMA